MTDYLEALWADHAPSDPDDPTWCSYCRDWGCQIRPLVAALRAVEALHPAIPIRLGFDAGKAMCGTCGTYAPCPTVTAIRDALGQP